MVLPFLGRQVKLATIWSQSSVRTPYSWYLSFKPWIMALSFPSSRSPTKSWLLLPTLHPGNSLCWGVASFSFSTTSAWLLVCYLQFPPQNPLPHHCPSFSPKLQTWSQHSQDQELHQKKLQELQRERVKNSLTIKEFSSRPLAHKRIRCGYTHI